MFMLKTYRPLAALGLLSALALFTAFSLTPAYAAKGDPQEWSDPTVSGFVTSTFWADSADPKNKTATIVVWSNDSDLAVNVFGDNPVVRESILNGTACVGRYVVVTGDRIEADMLSGQGIVVPNLDTPCTATLQ
jgi:hypothetical protein